MSEVTTNITTGDEESVDGVSTAIPTIADEEKLLSIAVIGTGNCGCMMASAAAEALGIDAIAINGSQRDLDQITCPKVVKFPVGDGKGTGKDRAKAKEFFLSNTGLTLNKNFQNIIEGNDVIVLTTSTGGGYGSGSSTELLELLQTMYPSKVTIVAGVLPFNDEGAAAFEGTKAWLKEIGELNPTYMIYDNNRYVGKTTPSGKVTPNRAAAMINQAFVEDLRAIQGDFIYPTRTGGMDQRDMLTVLSVPGRIFVHTMEDLEIADIIDNSLIKTVKEDIDENSGHAELVSDKEITASALMYSLGDEFNDVKINVKSDVQEIFGSHIKDMSNPSDDDNGIVALILSGLTEPAMVIDRIIAQSQKMEEAILGRKAAKSKLSKLDTASRLRDVKAKQSFADESSLVKASDNGGSTKEELLKKFMEKKGAASV